MSCASAPTANATRPSRAPSRSPRHWRPRSTGEPAHAAATLEHAPYGTTQAGQAVEIYTMTNDHGLRVRFLSYGGVITEIDAPDRTGRLDNIVLGLRNLHDYETLSAHYGAITGRYANRIAGAQFTLNGQTYHLIANNGANSLHGGPNALDKQVWDVAPSAGAERRRRHAQLCQQGRRAELSRHADHARDLHADQRQRAADRLPGHHRQGHGDQLHQPFLLQPGRQRLGFGRGSDAAGERGPLHAERARSDPHRRDRARSRARRSTSAR